MRVQDSSISIADDDVRDSREEQMTSVTSLLQVYSQSKARERRLRRELEDTLNQRESLALYELEKARDTLEEVRRIRMQISGDDPIADPHNEFEKNRDAWKWFNSCVRDVSDTNIPLEATAMTRGGVDHYKGGLPQPEEPEPRSPAFNYLAMRDNEDVPFVVDETERSSMSETDNSVSESLGSLASSINNDAGETVIREEHTEQRLSFNPLERSAFLQNSILLRGDLLGTMTRSFRDGVERAQGPPPLVAVKRESLLTLLKAFDQILLHELS